MSRRSVDAGMRPHELQRRIDLGGPNAPGGDRYATGLERVARVVEGSRDYDRILGAAPLERDDYGSIVHSHAAERAAETTRLFLQAVLETPFQYPQVPLEARVLADAGTANNRREVEFFLRRIGPACTANVVILQECPVEPWRPFAAELDTPQIRSALDAFFSRRPMLSRSLVHQLLSYTLWFSALNRVIAGLPLLRGLVVANDHSPPQVAVSMVAAMRGVRRLYLQHAEISAKFPPLDFEFSVLRNRRSREIYEAIEPPAGEVLIVPRRAPLGEEQIVRRLATACRGRISIGIYPSLEFTQQRLDRLVDAFRGFRRCDELFLKPHPRSVFPDDSVGLPIRRNGLDAPHLAIVGNSSIALELAASGNLVLQDFQLDSYVPDYYRFVADGLVAEFDDDLLQEAAMREMLARHEPSEALIAHLREQAGFAGDARLPYALRRIAIELGCGPDPLRPLQAQRQAFVELFPASSRRVGLDVSSPGERQ